MQLAETKHVPRFLIAELGGAYDDFFANLAGPFITIDTSPLDFVRHPEHLKLIESRIREALSISPFQTSLPMSD